MPDTSDGSPAPPPAPEPGWGVRRIKRLLSIRRPTASAPPQAAEQSSSVAEQLNALPPGTVREVLRELKESTRRQEAFLEQIRNHFLPQAVASRERRLFQLIKLTTIRVSMSGIGILLSWDFGMWYYSRWQTKTEAAQYATVATAMYEQEANPGVALDLLNHAIDLDHGNADYRYQRAYIEGLAAVRELLNLDRPLNKQELDRAHMALAQAKLLYGLDPARPESFILQGQIYTALKDYDKATAQLQTALKIAPTHEFARLRLGVLLTEQGQTTAGLRMIEDVVAAHPQSKWGWLWQGIVLARQPERTAEARAAYERAAKLDDKFDLAYYNLAWTYMQEGSADYPRAQELLERAIRYNPCYKEAYYALGMLYGYQNRYDTARVYLDKAIALDPQFTTALKWHGIVQCELHDYAAALKDFARAIELNPREPELYLRRARAYTELGQLDPCMTDLRFALELDPDNHRAWLNLGNAYLKAREYQRACDSYERAIKLKADYDEAYGQLAEAHTGLGQPELALADIDRALSLARYRPERWHLRRGELHEAGKAYDAAALDYAAARKLDAKLSEAWLGEARVLSQLNRTDEALRCLNEVIALRPDDAEARALQAKLAGPAAPKTKTSPRA